MSNDAAREVLHWQVPSCKQLLAPASATAGETPLPVGEDPRGMLPAGTSPDTSTRRRRLGELDLRTRLPSDRHLARRSALALSPAHKPCPAGSPRALRCCPCPCSAAPPHHPLNLPPQARTDRTSTPPTRAPMGSCFSPRTTLGRSSYSTARASSRMRRTALRRATAHTSLARGFCAATAIVCLRAAATAP